MEERGIVSFWNDEKGFGFINPLQGGERVFVHVKGIRNYKRPVGGELVCYTLDRDEKGRMRAINVRFVTGKLAQPPRTAAPLSKIAIGLVAAFFSFLVACLVFERLHVVLFLIYVVFSLIAFVMFWADKQRAEAQEWRVSEASLLLVSVAGGWPGAILAQQLFRHKLRKSTFMGPFWISVGLNSLALCFLLSPFSSILTTPLRTQP